MTTDNELTKFEKDALNLLLSGESGVISSLRNQLSSSHVGKRIFSGVGFFVDLSVEIENGCEQATDRSFQLSDVVAEVDGLKFGVGFVLFIENGVLSFFEGYTYDGEEWPNEVLNYKLGYINGKERDWSEIEKLWS